MTTSLVFLGLLMATIIGWLLTQSVGTTPWVSAGVDEVPDRQLPLGTRTTRFALVTFMAVATSFFALFISAYAMRMSLPDWVALDEPRIMFWNTAALVLSSIALQWASFAANRDDISKTRVLVQLGLGTALLFVIGQMVAWKQLIAAGMYLQGNPSVAFFYILTLLHGLHMLGGLWVLGRTSISVMGKSFEPEKIRKSISLCALYWHFLLLLWVGLFWLMLTT